MQNTKVEAIAKDWMANFGGALNNGDVKGLLDLLDQSCCWRDLLAFTWNIKTMEGVAAIDNMLAATLGNTTPSAWQVTSASKIESGAIQAWFKFKTQVGQCQGIFTLNSGKCQTILTTLQSLDGYEEAIGNTRVKGLTHHAGRNRETWSERREREEKALKDGSKQPYCLIVGGGQGGIMLGARLKQIGVPTVIVEKNEKAGDSWRNRYRSLVLHDPVWYDHLPYVPFPDHWPVFTPKDKMGDWLEAYVKIMELSYWGNTECISAKFDTDEKKWRVEINRNGARMTMHPTQLVFATGAYGPPKMIEFPGAEDFDGEILHSSQYFEGSMYQDKKVAVVGAASSGHDISVDLWEAGADVTMLQRSPTTVVRSETLMEFGFDIYSEEAVKSGIDVNTADMIAAAIPFALQPPIQREITNRIRERDADFYEKLKSTGFLIDFGEDDTGLVMKAMRTGSGYYLDVGASQLIIDGEIKIRAGVEIERLSGKTLHLSDGSQIEVDVIIQASGFQSMHEVVGTIVSRETADRIGTCWGLGSGTRNDPGPWHGELRNMYKPVAQENLWFQGGNLALQRFFSKFVALQIKARMEDFDTPVYDTQS